MQVTGNYQEQQELKLKVLAWLGVWHKVLKGEADPPDADPFYPRNEILTMVMAEAVCAEVQAYIQLDYQKYPDYHRNANGIGGSEKKMKAPAFDSLPLKDKFTLLQGLDKIYQEYRKPDSQPEPQPEPEPEYDWE